jgi:hypothetical protein
LDLSVATEGVKRIEVDMLTVDYVVEEFRLPVPHVIKIDTQGCELSILQGARKALPQIEALFLECWLTRAYGPSTPLLGEVAEWLRDFDFYLWELGNPWRDGDGTLVAQDCVFLNARSTASRLHQELSTRPKSASASRLPAREAEPLFNRIRDFLFGHSLSKSDQTEAPGSGVNFRS